MFVRFIALTMHSDATKGWSLFDTTCIVATNRQRFLTIHSAAIEMARASHCVIYSPTAFTGKNGSSLDPRLRAFARRSYALRSDKGTMLSSVPLVVGGKYQVSTNVLVSAGLANGSPVTLVDAVFPESTKLTKRTVRRAVVWEASQPASCIIVKLSRPLPIPHNLDLPSYLFQSSDDITDVRKSYIPLARSLMSCPITLPGVKDPSTGKTINHTRNVRAANVAVAPLNAITVEKR